MYSGASHDSARYRQGACAILTRPQTETLSMQSNTVTARRRRIAIVALALAGRAVKAEAVAENQSSLNIDLSRLRAFSYRPLTELLAESPSSRLHTLILKLSAEVCHRQTSLSGSTQCHFPLTSAGQTAAAGEDHWTSEIQASAFLTC